MTASRFVGSGIYSYSRYDQQDTDNLVGYAEIACTDSIVNGLFGGVVFY
jgi:hypothetical protein